MKTSNDRPRSTALGRAGFFYAKPRTAYAVCRIMNFAFSLAISIPVWIAGLNIYRHFGMDFSHWGIYAIWGSLFVFTAYSLGKNLHTLIAGIDSSDIRSLACLRKSNGIFWQGYGKSWISNFPHLAERIDHTTGNIGSVVASGSKPWHALETELEAMISLQE